MLYILFIALLLKAPIANLIPVFFELSKKDKIDLDAVLKIIGP